jgi:hypothetical protein
MSYVCQKNWKCEYTHNLLKERKKLVQKAHSERNMMLCHGMLLCNTGQIWKAGQSIIKNPTTYREQKANEDWGPYGSDYGITAQEQLYSS